MSETWLECLLPAILLLLLTGFLRKQFQSFLVPGVFFCTVWTAFVWIHLIFAPDYEIYPGAIWWILTSVACLILGHFTSSRIVAPVFPSRIASDAAKTQSNPKVTGAPRFLRSTLAIAILLGTVHSLLRLREMGRGLDSLTNLNDLATAANQFSLERYSEDSPIPPLITQCFLIPAFLAPMLGGTLFAYHNRKSDNMLSLLSLFPSLLIYATQSTRAPVLIAVLFWICVYCAWKTFDTRGHSPKLDPKLIRYGIGLLSVMVILVPIGDILRLGSIPTFESLLGNLREPRIRITLFGALPAFSAWFSQAWQGETTLAFGLYTFGGLAALLGIKDRDPGLYLGDNYLRLEGGATNIYTFYRGLIQDFGFAGSLLFVFLAGFVGGFCHRKVVGGDRRYLGIAAAFYAFSSYFVVSLFHYNSILFAWIVFSAYVWLARPDFETFGVPDSTGQSWHGSESPQTVKTLGISGSVEGALQYRNSPPAKNDPKS